MIAERLDVDIPRDVPAPGRARGLRIVSAVGRVRRRETVERFGIGERVGLEAELGDDLGVENGV